MARILLVDDYAGIRDSAKRYLDKVGHEVDLAISGEQALEMFQPGLYDLVITDLNMERGMTGIQLALKLKKFQPKPKIILSSSDHVDLTHTPEFGIDGFYLKNRGLEELNLLIKSLVSGQTKEG